MKTVLALVATLLVLMLPACSTSMNKLAAALYQEAVTAFESGDLRQAEELTTRLLKDYPAFEDAESAEALLTDIKEAISNAAEAARIEQYIEESESYRQQVADAHDWLSAQYSALVSEYEKQRKSLDYVEWSAFLHDWNASLREYREQLDDLKVNGHTPNLFWAWKQLQYSAGLMNGSIWQCHDNALLGKNPELFGREDLVYFDKEIQSALEEAKESLNAGG